jgi:hypothetical protein
MDDHIDIINTFLGCATITFYFKKCTCATDVPLCRIFGSPTVLQCRNGTKASVSWTRPMWRSYLSCFDLRRRSCTEHRSDLRIRLCAYKHTVGNSSKVDDKTRVDRGFFFLKATPAGGTRRVPFFRTGFCASSFAMAQWWHYKIPILLGK